MRDCFAVEIRHSPVSLPPVTEKDSKAAIVDGIGEENKLMIQKTPKDRSPSAIERLLDSLKLSSKLRRDYSQGNDKEKLQVPGPITANANSRSNKRSLIA